MISTPLTVTQIANLVAMTSKTVRVGGYAAIPVLVIYKMSLSHCHRTVKLKIYYTSIGISLPLALCTFVAE